MSDRPGGTYGFDETIRWADGRPPTRRSWTEQLTSGEATARLGPTSDSGPAPDLLAFLAAVHDADEQAARLATSGRWGHEDVEVVARRPHGTIAPITTSLEHVARCASADAAHIARHDPQSVLARVEAERMLMSGHEALGADLSAQCANTCAACYREELPCDDRRVQMPCPTLRALAWGYRHREGFDPAWAPDGVEVGA